MAVFRVERNSGYTVMSNHHLRNKELTLKAKGLLSQMLSLPEDWDYTLAGLSHINRESIDAIRTAVWELEKAGYILRRQGRDEKGKMTAIEYTIYEQPQPMLENPIPGKPMLENPTTENPTSENPTQLNKDRSRTNLSKKEKSITDLSNTDSFPILSPDPSPCRAAPERKGTEAFKQSAVDIYREIIMENIEYDTLTQDPKMDKERLDEIVDLMLETVCSARKTLRIAGDDYPAELVKSKFLKLNSSHIEFVMDDPQAAAKLEAKLVKLESAQETMKAELAIQTALRTDNNRLIYEKGSRELPKEYRFEATPDREYGKFVRYEAVPHDPDALRDLLRDESRKRERLKPGNFREHIGRLSDEKVLAEAQRLSAAFQSLQAPNSPNGTHFVAEVSPWFERIASSKEHERLFALLPYKTLYLSSVKDRHGVFAFISKDERRDLPLRKQRPSVRAQLKKGQSKKTAAPKKAAAKAKDNDLEV